MAQYNFVFVHGLSTGGWVWRWVAEELRSHGHRVLTPTLTGVGDRYHLLSAAIDLETHVADVTNLFDFESLQNVVLIGRSAGGLAATMVADLRPSTIRRLVYLDALVPLNGECGFDLLPPGMEEERRRAVKQAGAGIAFPIPTRESVGLEDQERLDWFMGLLRPFPYRVYETPVRLSGLPGAGLPVTYVAYTQPALPAIEPSRQRARGMQGWNYVELAAIHDAEIEKPEEVALFFCI